MLLFAVCWISISITLGVDYEALVADLEDTLYECTSVIDNVWKHIGEVDFLGDVRRRDEDEDGSHAVQDALGACVSIRKAVDNYRDTHSWLTAMLVLNFVTWQENAYLNQLLDPVSKEIGMPIYVASRDGDRASDFHDHCDGQGPTVVIIETTTGHVFGGYTDVSWGSDVDCYSSSTSFLFQLRPNFGQYKIKIEHCAAYHHIHYGPTFGGGHDLMVSDLAMNNSDSDITPNSYDVLQSNLNGGVRKFQVRDYVVFEAIALTVSN